jgi:hypothetical protein
VGLFVAWYVVAHGGWGPLLAQVGRLTSVAGNASQGSLAGDATRFINNVITLGFRTPTEGPPPTWSGRDWWLVLATIGMLFLPSRDWRFRVWVPAWLLGLMFGVFQKLDNVPLFFYPATLFLPLYALGVAGVATWLGEGLLKVGMPGGRNVPAVVVCGLFGLAAVNGALGGFRTKIDLWSQQSVPSAEAAMAWVNERTAPDDLVVVPKQIYWLAKANRRSMLTYCARAKGFVNDMPVPVAIPQELYWFDSRLENAKYVVMEYSVNEQRMPVGIDAVYTLGLRGVREVLQQMQEEKWPQVFNHGAYRVFANPRFNK